MAIFLLLALAASVYVIFVLEILKLRRFRHRGDPAEPVDPDVDEAVARELETGEYEAGPPPKGGTPRGRDDPPVRSSR